MASFCIFTHVLFILMKVVYWHVVVDQVALKFKALLGLLFLFVGYDQIHLTSLMDNDEGLWGPLCCLSSWGPHAPLCGYGNLGFERTNSGFCACVYFKYGALMKQWWAP